MRREGLGNLKRFAVLAASAAAMVLPAPATAAFDEQSEARNFSKINERATYEHGTPEYRALLAEQAVRDEQERAEIRVNDPERDFSGNLCAQHKDGCAGDVRLYDWAADGHGVTVPVLYVARSGAIIYGHIWATRDGPARRPGVVITTGSVQAPEELYLYAATTLAKRGYVVMTYDVQGQGRSDTYGEDPDRNEGVPAQQPANFVNGTQDALRFFLSTPTDRYVPAPSDSTGTVHSARQERRVAEGRNAPHNPLHEMLDPQRLGIAGHSLGAFAVSSVCCDDDSGRQGDERVDAVVAWDNLSAGGGQQFGQDVPLITPRVPALGMSADYGLTPTPFTAEPDPDSRNGASRAYSAAGVDTMQVNIRGGTHYEFSYIPDPAFGATLRGMDAVAWYTAAWFDKYVKGDAGADARLLTRRWADDAREREVDPDGDGNTFSRYFRSRIDIAASGGGRVKCGDLRDLVDTEPGDNCAAASVPDDGEPAGYSYLAEAKTPDGAGYPRPKGATPLRVSLVPAYQPCAAPNRTHGPPLAFGSCSPPRASSGHLTVGTPDANGNGANFTGSVRLSVAPGDVRVDATLADVRRADDRSDYPGELQGRVSLRLTDKGSSVAPSALSYDEPATVQDFPFAFTIPCAATAGAQSGASCAVATSANALLPGSVAASKRAIWQISAVEVFDGGADGDAATTPNTLFARQGIFVP